MADIIKVQIKGNNDTLWTINEPVNFQNTKLKDFTKILQIVQKKTNELLTELVDKENSDGDIAELVDEDDSDADEDDTNKRKNVSEDTIEKKIKSA